MNLIIKTFLLFYYIPILLANTINVANEYVDNTFSLSSLPDNPRDRQQAMALAITASRHGLEIAKSAQKDAATFASATVPNLY